MIIDNVKCKLVSLNSYFKKDEKGNKTEEKGYMFGLVTDFRDGELLKNKYLNPMCGKEFKMLCKEEELRFGATVVCSLDLPLVEVGDKATFPTMLLSIDVLKQ